MSQAIWDPDLPRSRPTHLPQDNQRLGSPILLRPSFASRHGVGRFDPKVSPLVPPILGWARTRWYRNINLLCIDYASRPRLSSRLTLGGISLPQEPLGLRRRGFSPLSRYSCQHSHSIALHDGSHPRFAARSTLPYHFRPRRKSAASALDLSPVTLSAQGHSTSELLRTL